MNSSSTIIHVYREANQCADYLAKMGVKHKTSGSIFPRNADFNILVHGDNMNIPFIKQKAK